MYGPKSGVTPPSIGGTGISAGMAALAAYEATQWNGEALLGAAWLLVNVTPGFNVPTGWTLHCGPVAVPTSGAGSPFGAGVMKNLSAEGGSHWAGSKLFGPLTDASTAGVYNADAHLGTSNVYFIAQAWLKTGSPTLPVSIRTALVQYAAMPLVLDLPWVMPIAQVISEALPKTKFKDWALPDPFTDGGYAPPATGSPVATIPFGRPPARRTKEKKFRSNGAMGSVFRYVGKTMNVITESCDAIESLYDALPKEHQKRYYYKRTADGKVVKPGDKAFNNPNTKWIKPSCQNQLRQVYNKFDHIEWDEAAKNLIENEIEDQVIGRSAKAANRAFNRTSGARGFGGLGLGPAL